MRLLSEESSRESWKHATRPLEEWFSAGQCCLIHVYKVGGQCRRRVHRDCPNRDPGNLVGMLLASDVGGLILAGMPSLALRLYAGGVT